MTWVPDACTLPTAERPLRVAEFDRLFGRTLQGVRRTSPTTVELDLAVDARPELDDLIAREKSCCSFFSFAISSDVQLAVSVLPAHTPVLDALVERL